MVRIDQRLIRRGQKGTFCGVTYQAHARNGGLGCNECAFKSDTKEQLYSCRKVLCGAFGSPRAVYFVKV